MQPHMSVTFYRNHQAAMIMNFNVELFLALSVMPVSGLASFVTMMLVLVRECIWIWNVLEGGLNLVVDI